MKFYLASGLSNIRNAATLCETLERLGYPCTYNWMRHGAAHDRGWDGLAEVAAAELHGVADADLVIILLPGGRGTHVELGAALALGKPVVILDPDQSHKLHEMGAHMCSFYTHPGVVHRVGDSLALAVTPEERLSFYAGVVSGVMQRLKVERGN